MAKTPSLKRFAGLFNLLFFHDNGEYSYFKTLLEETFKSVSYEDLNSCNLINKDIHLVLVCGDNQNFPLENMMEKLTQYKYLSSAFISNKYISLEACQFANKIKASVTLPVPKDEKSFKKLISSILPELRKKYSEDILNQRNAKLANAKQHLHVLYNQTQATYMSEQLKSFLGLEDLEAYKAHEYNRMVLSKIESLQSDTNEVLTFSDGSSCFVTYSKLLSNDKLVSFIPLLTSLTSTDDKILNRISFIEVLKDLSLKEEFQKNDTPLVVLSIQNSENILQTHSETFYNELVLKQVKMMSNLCDGVRKMAQWHKNILIIQPNTNDMNMIAQQVEKINEQSQVEGEISGVSLLVSTFVVNIKALELNKIIIMIDHLANHNLDRKDLHGIEYIEVSVSDEENTQTDKTFYYFEKAMLEKAEIKLCNFYKGLNISSFAQIIKMDKEKIYVIKDKMQGYAMKAEGSVLIQSPLFPMDIIAKVKLVDISKKIAILSDFQTLNSSANNRQYIRVQSDYRMHISISAKAQSFSATVLDIYIKAMACSLSNVKNTPEVGNIMKLQFQLPSKRFDEGMAQLNIEGVVTHLVKRKDEVKLVFDLRLEEPYESYLLEYIYERQQVLIQEVKQIAQRLSQA